MKLIVSILLIAVLAILAGLFSPWWSIAIVAFLVGVLVPQKAWHGFLAGFIGIFLAWAVVATWIDVKNDSILSQRIAALFHLGTSSVLLILVTGFIGGLVGGFAAMAGTALRPYRRKRVHV